jgi:DNA-binding CsgD family transcriptional regulator
MGTLSSGDRARLGDIRHELETVRLDGRSVMRDVLGGIRELVATDAIVNFCPVERVHGWDLERFDHDGFSVAAGFARRFSRFLDDAPRRFAWYDAVSPEPEQRNVVLEAIERIPPGELERSRMYREVLHPLGLERHRQLRALMCEGPSLLAWFGAIHDGPVEARQYDVLRALVAPLSRRLALERRLADAPLAIAALASALDHLGAPAFVVDRRARIRQTNAAGRALLDQRRADVVASLDAAIQGRPAPLAFEVTAVGERGAPAGWIAVLEPASADARVAASVAAAASRWRLTRRQTEVLGHVVDGRANAHIAATLGVSRRAVELQVTAIFQRAGVENRAALVAAALASLS